MTQTRFLKTAGVITAFATIVFAGMMSSSKRVRARDAASAVAVSNQICEKSVTSAPMPEFVSSLGEETKKGAGKLASASPNLISGKRYDLSLRSSGTANPRHSSVKEPGSGAVVLPAVMIRAKSPGSAKLLFRNA
jgi:hypothetical protein